MTRVYLAVGHGRKPDGTYDPGAVSADGRWSEQKAGDVIVAEAARVLRAWGLEVRDEANKDDPNFAGTAAAANVWGADCVVSIHHDWKLAPEGAFGHWYAPKSKPLADAIQAAVGEAGFPLRPDWHKPRTDLSLLKRTQAPVVLYEVGRIGQASIDEPAELQAMGRAIAAGIARYLGLETEEVDDMTQQEKEMLQYAAMWALEAKTDALIARYIAEGDAEAADKIRAARPEAVRYWRERWGVR